MRELKDKVVLVTGGAHGIGRATAEAFAAAGARIVIADIDLDAAEATAKAISDDGGSAVAWEVDVADARRMEQLCLAVIDEMGGVDVAVLNAGVSVSGPPDQIPLEDWEWICGINLWQHVYAVHFLLPHFKQRGAGHFVHVASAAALFGTPGLAPYSMTKFGVLGLAESLAVSLQGTDIGVSVVCPLWVATDIAERGRYSTDPVDEIHPDAVRALGSQLLKSSGIPASEVADGIVEAVKESKFLVLPHPEVMGMVQAKWADPEGFIERAAQVSAGITTLSDG